MIFIIASLFVYVNMYFVFNIHLHILWIYVKICVKRPQKWFFKAAGKRKFQADGWFSCRQKLPNYIKIPGQLRIWVSVLFFLPAAKRLS